MPTLFAADFAQFIVPAALILFWILKSGIQSFTENSRRSGTEANQQRDNERFMRELGLRRRLDNLESPRQNPPAPKPRESRKNRNRSRGNQANEGGERLAKHHLHTSFEDRKESNKRSGLQSSLELQETEVIVTPNERVELTVDEKLTMPMRAIATDHRSMAAMLKDKKQLARWLVLGRVLDKPVGFDNK